MYVRGYLQGSENGRVVTIGSRYAPHYLILYPGVVVPATLHSISVNAHFTRFL